MRPERFALKHFGRVSLRTAGRSMWPLVRPGALVEVVAIDPAQLRPGDLVAIERDEGLLLHRLVRRTSRGELVLRGDANAREDPPVQVERVLGYVPNLVLGSFEVPGSASLARAVRPLAAKLAPPIASHLVARGGKLRQSVRRKLGSRMLQSR